MTSYCRLDLPGDRAVEIHPFMEAVHGTGGAVAGGQHVFAQFARHAQLRLRALVAAAVHLPLSATRLQWRDVTPSHTVESPPWQTASTTV